MNKLQVSADVPTEIHMTRTFDAPRRLVIRAMTEPELIKRWHGGVRAIVASSTVDLRVGGSYRTVFRLPDGTEFSFSGVYREVSDDCIVHTETFNDAPIGSVVTMRFEEHAGKTTMRCVIAFDSQAMRDMVLATGMADGAGESYDALDKLLADL